MTRHPRSTFGGARIAGVSLLAFALVAALWAFFPRPSVAQGKAAPGIHYATGPFLLHDGEHALIALLLPAVQRARSEANFMLLDSSGKVLFEANPSPAASGRRTAFFDITYRAPDPADNSGVGVFEIRESPSRPSLGKVSTPDGILIGLLLPAVQFNGKPALPLATSMQSFNAQGGTMTHSFFDVFTEVD